MARPQKTTPIKAGDRYVYTLSSYEPVEVTVRVARVTEDEVEQGLADMVAYYGGSMDALTDEWVAEQVKDVTTVAELRPYVRSQLEAMYAEAGERSKADLCVRELATRLCQEVPEEELARARAIVRASMERDLEANGMDVAGFLTMSGMSETAFEAMVDQEALEAAEREAALEAFVSGRELTVDETEYPALLGLSPTKVAALIADMREMGHGEYVRHAALHAKAVRVLVEECTCTYEHETPAMARLRREQYREVANRMAARRDEGGPRLKLV